MIKDLRENEVVAARLTIFGAARMTKKGRRVVAKWITQMAEDLIKDGDKYAERCICRFAAPDPRKPGGIAK